MLIAYNAGVIVAVAVGGLRDDDTAIRGRQATRCQRGASKCEGAHAKQHKCQKWDETKGHNANETLMIGTGV